MRKLFIYLTGTRSYDFMKRFKAMEGKVDISVEGKYSPYCGLLYVTIHNYTDKLFLGIIGILNKHCREYGLKFCVYEEYGDSERAVYVPRDSFRNNINNQNCKLL